LIIDVPKGNGTGFDPCPCPSHHHVVIGLNSPFTN
jgi:hypothetical protein